MPYGFSLPFHQSTGSSDFFETTGDISSALSTNARSLLLTNWGERPMRFRFGCNLRQYLFEQLDPSLAPVVADRIVQQFTEWLPALRIDSLNVLFEGDDPVVPANGFFVRMGLSIVSDPSRSFIIEQGFGV